MKNLKILIKELGEHIPEQALINPHVSKGSVGWHIAHSLLTINQIIGALELSNPEEYKRTIDVRRSLVLFFGIIPRGKIKAPNRVQPQMAIDETLLAQNIRETERNLALLDRLGSGNFFHHPFLGDFRLKPAIRFMQVHTNHHLKIIKDIVSK